MKNFLFIILLSVSTVVQAHALIINEIMSNPVGDDGGREWVELYNNSSSTLDISNLSISIKGGAFVSTFSVNGGTIISPDGYGIIASTVSGATKFLQDYPTYNGPLLRSSISLVNTGVTSIEIKVSGVSLDVLSSYIGAKEGLTLSKINGSFVIGNPTPGSENQIFVDDAQTQATTTSNTASAQTTISQMSPPLTDIVLYMPQEKVAVAGAETNFSVFGLTRAGKNIDNLTYTWAYGDGGDGNGSSTLYRYAYPGRYITSVEGSNGYLIGIGRMNVRVVAPDIVIKNIHNGKYGRYIDIENPNTYDLDLSQWKLAIDNIKYPFPKNTILAGNTTTHISGVAMGFASTTIATSTIIKILFPNQEEVTRYIPSQQPQEKIVLDTTVRNTTFITKELLHQKLVISKNVPKNILQQKQEADSVLSKNNIQKIPSQKIQSKDTRLLSFLKSFFENKN